MKKVVVLLSVLILNPVVNGQGIKDKLSGVKDKMSNNETKTEQKSGLDEVTFFAFPTDNQPVVAQKFFANNKNLVWCSITWKKRGFEDYQGFNSGSPKYSVFDEFLKNIPTEELVSFTLPDDIERGKKRVFTPNHPTSSYFFAHAYMSDKYVDGSYLVESNTAKVMFFEHFAIYFKNFSRNSDKFEIAECHILVDASNEHHFTAKGLEYKEAINKINITATNYFKHMSQGVKDATAAAEAERYAKLGLKNKDVVGLTIEVHSTNKNTQGSIFGFTVKAKLKDGSTIDVNYLNDLEIKTQGLVQSVLGSGYVVDSKNFIKDDQIKLTVTSKFHKGISATYETPVNYTDATFAASFNGKFSGTTRPHGGSVKVEVKSMVCANTGIELYAYKIRANGEDYAQIKLPKTSILAIYAKGANARSNDKYSGNGGILGFVKDPSAKDCVITYNIDPGTVPLGIRPGNNGVYTETVQKVNW
jgi:hypothetical protein